MLNQRNHVLVHMNFIPMSRVGTPVSNRGASSVGVSAGRCRTALFYRFFFRFGERLTGNVKSNPFKRHSHLRCSLGYSNGATCDGYDIWFSSLPLYICCPPHNFVNIWKLNEFGARKARNTSFRREDDPVSSE